MKTYLPTIQNLLVDRHQSTVRIFKVHLWPSIFQLFVARVVAILLQQGQRQFLAIVTGSVQVGIVITVRSRYTQDIYNSC